MAPTVSGLLQAVNHDYTIWIAGAIVVVFGLYWVRSIEQTHGGDVLTQTVVDID